MSARAYRAGVLRPILCRSVACAGASDPNAAFDRIESMTTTDWPHSQLLGRPLEPSELEQSGTYMTIHVGGPLDGDVLLVAAVAAQRVSVTARWRAGAELREAHSEAMAMADAELLAAQWADELGEGLEPSSE
jgi:hypothetical protein